MKRNKMTVLVLSVTLILILGIFLSFYWSFVGISNENSQIVLPSGDTPAVSDETETDMEKVEISKENVQRVVASMNRPDIYTFESKVTLYSSTGNTSWKNKQYTKNAYTKTEQYDASGHLIKNVIIGNDMIFIWRAGGDARYYSGHIGDATSDTVQMIPTYEDTVNRKPLEILDAKYESYEGSNCIYVKAEDSEFQYIDEYWISLDYGILIHAVTTSDDETIYEMNVDKISTGNVSDSVFLLPNNTLAMDVTLS